MSTTHFSRLTTASPEATRDSDLARRKNAIGRVQAALIDQFAAELENETAKAEELRAEIANLDTPADKIKDLYEDLTETLFGIEGSKQALALVKAEAKAWWDDGKIPVTPID